MGRVTFKSNNLMAHYNGIVSGYGVGVMPLAFVEPELPITRIMPEDTHLEDLWIVAHEDLTKSVRIRAVFDFLVDALKKDRGHFLGEAPSIFECSMTMTCGESKSPDHQHVLVNKDLVEA